MQPCKSQGLNWPFLRFLEAFSECNAGLPQWRGLAETLSVCFEFVNTISFALYTYLEIQSLTVNFHNRKFHWNNLAWKLFLRLLNQTVEKRKRCVIETSQSTNGKGSWEVCNTLQFVEFLSRTIVCILQRYWFISGKDRYPWFSILVLIV